MSGRAPARLLIVLLGAIGDVVRGLPVAMRLRAAWPKTVIAWAVEPPAEPLVRHHPAVDRVIRFQRQGGVRAFVRFLGEIRSFGADVTLDLQRHLKSGVVSAVSGAPLRIGFHRKNSREGNWLFQTRIIPPVERFTPKVLQFQRFADVLGAPVTPIRFGLRSGPEARAAIDARVPGPPVRTAAVLTGSTWPSRFWPARHVASLCRGLRERGLLPVLVGGAAERSFAAEVAEADPGEVVDLVGRTSLEEVVALLERATVAVGPDSGPMHIAAAVGTPVVSLWGATSPARSAPLGYEHLVVRASLPCVPCYRKQCPIGRLCMESITPQRVLRMVDRALDAEKGKGDAD